LGIVLFAFSGGTISKLVVQRVLSGPHGNVKGVGIPSWNNGTNKMKQPIPIFQANIVAGKIKMLDHVKQAIIRWCMTFKTGAHVEIIIRKHRSKRTNDQNAYYFGVVVKILADHFGYEPEECHEELKLLFNPIQSKIDPSRTIGGSTTKMSTVEFFHDEDSYVERIARWAATEHQVFIPPPEKAEKEDA